MSEKAKSVITDALALILVQGEEEPIEQPDALLAVRVLNRMMSSLTIHGINIGFTEVADFSSPMTVPDPTIGPIINLLARYLHPFYFRSEPNPLIIAEAKNAFRQLQHYRDMAPSEYPDNLPRGSGNDLPDFHSYHFYGDLEDTILAEISGNILLEDDTESA